VCKHAKQDTGTEGGQWKPGVAQANANCPEKRESRHRTKTLEVANKKMQYTKRKVKGGRTTNILNDGVNMSGVPYKDSKGERKI